MLVEDVRTEPLDRARVQVSARCAGRPLYYCLPESHLSRQAIGDALVISALVPAMRVGETLRLPDSIPVSSVLAAHLEGIQRIWIGWNPRLRRVGLEASLYDPSPSASGVSLFYAGGVDSSYSLISHLDEVDVLVIAFGFDHTMSDEEARESLERNGRFAKRLGKELLHVDTNHSRFLTENGVSRTFVFGATLAAIGLLLGMKRSYIASSHSSSYLRPEGSHPALDPRFSNGTTEIVHDDISMTRFEKTYEVAQRPLFLENLRVCWEQPNENCGVCLKCLRTMTALRVCGTQGPFPPLGDIRRVRQMAAQSEVEYVMSTLLAAHAKGDAEVERELRKGLRRHDWGEVLRHLDLALTGGKLLRARRAKSAEAGLVKLNLRPDIDLN